MPPVLIADKIEELLPMHRMPGNHVSHIINRLAVRLGTWKENDDDTPSQIQFEMGNSVEDVVADSLARRYAKHHPDRYIHGLALERDGIHGNLDLLDTIDGAVEDVKLTKKSLRHDIEGGKFWHNWVQIMAYCYMVGVNIGRLHVVFVNGNYKYDRNDPDAGWQYRVWEDRWTDKQLMDNWRMLLGHREAA